MEAKFIGSAVYAYQYPSGTASEIAFAGRSNVGKSSLINCLVERRNLARTSSEPGRTRAINFFSVSDSLVFVDLPGYGFARVPLNVKESWRRMVEQYLLERPHLKGVVVIMDIRRGVSVSDEELFKWLRLNSIPSIAVLTKADRVSKREAAVRHRHTAIALSELGLKGPVLFSSRTRLGREELWGRINGLVGLSL